VIEVREGIDVRRMPVISVLLAALLLAAACQGQSTEPGAGGSPQGSPSASPISEAAPTSATLDPKDYGPELFDETSHIVDNEWFPLVPGTRYVWEGKAFTDEGDRIDRKVEFIVTDLTKVIGGVRAVVGWDRDYNDDVLAESELIFYAQDRFGTVWHLGEYVEHWEDGELDGGRLWVVGDPEGAQAGIGMPADPTAVEGAYSQGFAPKPWFWNDDARVADVGVRTCVPVDCFDDAIVIEEFEPRFPHAFQLKYYAQGVGGIRVGWRGREEEEHETMALTVFEQLSDAELTEVREAVLAQERRALAYSLSTEPMEQVGP
jgi:hypothetical protein